MREILFRGKSLDSGKWIKGDYFREMDQYGRIFHRIFKSLDYGYWHKYGVDPGTVGQYTGLEDKNGVKIFEGDILRFWGDYDDESETATVVYCGESGYPAFDLQEHEFDCNGLAYINQSGEYTCEVIGNIYDNPELLGK